MTGGNGLVAIFLLFCAGCASAPVAIETPNIIIGVLSKPRATGWYRNICFEGDLVRDLPDSGYCIPHGGVVYRVRLKQPRDMHGKRLGRYLDVAYAAHSLRFDYRKPEFDVVLQPAPEEFKKSTGIAYFATASQIFNADAKCVLEIGSAHTDMKLCSDEKFHGMYRNHCVPVQTFLKHYSEH